MKINKIKGFCSALVLATSVLATSCMFLPDDGKKSLDLGKMQIIFEDNFDGTAGSKIDTEVWNEVVWAAGKVNNEVQSYAKNHAKIVNDDDAEDGKALRITATKNGANWESGRVDTSRHEYGVFKYGYAEARIKLPLAYDSSNNLLDDNKGVWPAFWMMPEDAKYYDEETESEKYTDGQGVYGVWPRSGEIDIMEYSPATSGDSCYATLHHAASKTDATDTYPSLGKMNIAADGEYHTFGMMWKSGTLEAYYDGKSLGTIYSNPGNSWAKYPYDQNFYLILNLAMGGNLGGAINSDIAKVEYDIDYVRVYQ